MKIDNYDFVKQLLTAYEQASYNGLNEQQVFAIGSKCGKDRMPTLQTVYKLQQAGLISKCVVTAHYNPSWIEGVGRIKDNGKRLLKEMNDTKTKRLIRQSRGLGTLIAEGAISKLFDVLL